MMRLLSAIGIFILIVYLSSHNCKAGNAQLDSSLGSNLINAADRGSINDVLSELKNGVDVNKPGFVGITPLMRAAYKGHINIVKLLLEHHANVLAKDEGGASALHYAVRAGNSEIVDLLIEYGANVHDVDKSGYSAIQRAEVMNKTTILNNIKEIPYTKVVISELPLSPPHLLENDVLAQDNNISNAVENVDTAKSSELIVGKAVLVKNEDDAAKLQVIEKLNVHHNYYLAVIDDISNMDLLMNIWNSLANNKSLNISASIDSNDEKFQLILGHYSELINAQMACSIALEGHSNSCIIIPSN